MILATAVQCAFRADGWIHLLTRDGYDVLRGPLGVLLYLAFVPLYAFIPRTHRATFLSASSLLLALVTLGHAYVLTILALVLIGLGVIRSCATPSRYWLGVAILVAWFAALLIWPQPPWLPRVREPEPVYFYLHWAGLAYLFLKTLHVLADVSGARMGQPGAGDFLAYLLFAPTLRMGPIYRYREFAEQLHSEPQQHRSLRIALFRLITGLVRLGIMGYLLKHFPLHVLFNEPERLSATQCLMGVYVAPMTFFLWMSAYVDFGIAVGRTMGFVVPESFNYCWFARNISDFWQRWHITLGAWLRDYLFKPLVRRRWHFFWSFTLTFLFIGLWHAPWPCYLLWGVAQGVGLGARRYWMQFWKSQRARDTSLYRHLLRARLVGTPFSTFLGWFVTFHYEIVTLTIGVDVDHAGARVLGRLIDPLGPLAGM